MGDLVVDVPPESQVHKQVVRKRAEARDITLDPATRLYFVEVQEPDMHKPSGDAERLCDALAAQWDIEGAQLSPALLARLQPALRAGNWQITCAVHTPHDGAAPQIMEIWPGYHEGPIYGLAVDLGSTTIAAHSADPLW